MNAATAQRVIEFASEGASLRVRYGQLVIRREDHDDVSTPLSEIAVLILANPRVNRTQSVLSGLVQCGAAVVVCDETMQPSGVLLPMAAHWKHTERLLAQTRASEPRRKRIWQHIVRAKIRAQGSVLALRTGSDAGLNALAERVRSGDPDNLEAQAAQRYWPLVFSDSGFRRRRDAPDQNRLLNYGYAIMRAAVGRAICATGLHPSLGVHHRGRSNPFCLADDLIEPWRAMVDAEVAEIVGETGADTPLDSRTKARLIGLLHERLPHLDEARPVVHWINRSASFLAAALTGDQPVRELSVFFPSGLTDV